MTLKFQSSIRTRLFAIFLVVMVSLQVLFWLVSANTMQALLIYGKEMDMKKVISNFQNESALLSVDDAVAKEDLLARMAYNWDGNLSVVDLDKDMYTSTIPKFSKDRNGPPNRERFFYDLAKQYGDLKIGAVTSTMVRDPNGRAYAAVVIGRVGDSQYLFSEKPLGVLRDSSALVSKYIILSGILTIAIGSLLIHFFATRISRPIIEIEKQAVQIAKLDFKNQNNVTQNDEIGSLGRAVNEIAVELENTISQLTEVNHQLKGEIEQERQLERLRRQFVSHVSHELRTPISMILGYADGLKHGIARSESQREHYCNVIINESERMSTLISHLLDMSAYQDGKLPFKEEVFNVSQLTQAVTSHFGLEAETKSIEVKTGIEKDLYLNGDSKRIEQVLNNLLSNAFKHVSDKGLIEVSVHRSEAKVMIEVYNQGALIPQDELDLIWMSFYRGSNARENELDGFGIGLALVKEIVERHRGKCYAENRASGVSFLVELPLHRIEAI